MKLGILGTGAVGKTLAEKLAAGGHEVIMGTRNVENTLAGTKADVFGNPPFAEWQKKHSSVKLDTFENAAKQGEVLLNTTSGQISLEALNMAGAENLKGKILIDIANPLDFSNGMPPTLSVCNTDSLGEQIQRNFPETKVVKTLNTLNAYLMTNPKQLANGDHTLFVSGNDQDAKNSVKGYLESWFGWKPENVIDLGDIKTARGTEMLLPIWLQLWNKLGNATFNFKLVK